MVEAPESARLREPCSVWEPFRDGRDEAGDVALKYIRDNLAT